MTHKDRSTAHNHNLAAEEVQWNYTFAADGPHKGRAGTIHANEIRDPSRLRADRQLWFTVPITAGSSCAWSCPQVIVTSLDA
jgi:hypothetical protein